MMCRFMASSPSPCYVSMHLLSLCIMPPFVLGVCMASRDGIEAQDL